MSNCNLRYPDLKDTNQCLKFEDNFIPVCSIHDADGLNGNHSVALNLLSHVGTGVDVLDGDGQTDWCDDTREDIRRGYQRCQTITVTSEISSEHDKVYLCIAIIVILFISISSVKYKYHKDFTFEYLLCSET